MKISLAGIKSHFQEHKTAYLVGGALVVGVGIGFALRSPKITQSVKTWVFAYKSTVEISNNVTNIIALGDPGNVTRCLEDGKIFASQGAAARFYGLNPSNLSEHLNGVRDAVKGLHFEILGKAGHELASFT